jgi:RNA polymerase sigma-70 factor (ECF subfamily)
LRVPYNKSRASTSYTIEYGELMNDADLVKRFRKGDEEAFSELVRRHMKPLTMMILRMVRDEEEARDLSQAAFIKAFEALPRFMMASSFKTWLYRIAVNAVTDHLRKRRPTPDSEAVELSADPGRSVAEQMEKFSDAVELRKAVEKLPDKQRITLQLRIYEELDYHEIARIVGGTTGSARANFFQATKSLKAMLGASHETT